MTILQAQSLAKVFTIGFFRKKVHAVADVSLRVEKGQIFGLLGPNGAGKTTTLKILLGLIRPSAGSATVLGAPTGDIGAKQRLGYLPESPYFYDYLTGKELLVFMAKLFGIRRREALSRAEALLERVGMSHAADLALRRYSKGMLQRVGIAQALINEPELVILDEPLTGLDPIGRKDLRALIAELRDQGKTVILSSHILSDVELLADEVAILVKGRTVNTGPLRDLLDARVLSTEVVFGPLGDELRRELAAAGREIRHDGEDAQITVDGDDELEPLLAQIQAGGGKIKAIAPRKESLEDLVVRQAEAEG